MALTVLAVLLGLWPMVRVPRIHPLWGLQSSSCENSQACRPDRELYSLCRHLMHAGAFSNWQGMAPGAKIAFQDLGSGNTGTLSVPYDLFSDYFPYNYQWYPPPRPDLLQRPHA